MKITALRISNFKAARYISLEDIGDVVVIAGPNGCGKSCILDATRFLKSVYAGYARQDEWHSFFNEFMVNMQSAEEIRRLFYDPDLPLTIEAEFVLSEVEKNYIIGNVRRILRKDFAAKHIGARDTFFKGARIDSQELDLDALVEKYSDLISTEVMLPSQTAKLTLTTEPSLETADNIVLQFVFGIYDPAHIGIIDYHSANRAYQREKIGGINVNIEETSQRLAQHALFNWQNKYTNIKSELAAAFIRDIFAERAGGDGSVTPSILSTMKELFQHFLPTKRFTGPVPGKSGELTFPVELASGGKHDIDDLSSGEKELVYGYLRLRNVSPANSIILLDEPELHLNPRLVLGLPNFYRKHLGLELGNQLWMTTHSDAFLRDAYKGGGFTIFHMSPAGSVASGVNQAVPISAEDEVDRAIVDLVGDIAGYRPGSKIVIFESSQSANFDAAMTKLLFPEFAESTNTLSGDNKFGVEKLYSALNKAVVQMKLPYQVYAIVDRDTEATGGASLTKVFSWDAYHIENYLLNEEFIGKVMADNPSFADRMNETQISDALKKCAEESLPDLIRHKMRVFINSRLVTCLDLGFDPKIIDISTGFCTAVKRVGTRMDALAKSDLSGAALKSLHDEIAADLRMSIVNNDWRTEVRGRDILRRFGGKFLRGLPYEAFRDAIVARMGDANYRPKGMASVIGSIMDSSGERA